MLQHPTIRNSNGLIVIRAYYSKRNETMLTCTVSMVENAIAIIATCLPALRTMILGKNTTQGESNTYGKHYELSSARRKANENRLTASHHNSRLHSTHNTRNRANGSEDSLFSDGHLDQPGEQQAAGKIVVNTQIQTMFEDTGSASDSLKSKSPF
jgi:hypothetical protein